MLNAMSTTGDIPIEAVIDAVRRPEVVEAMQAFYAEADRRIAANKPTCWNKGECCRFGEYGHRLYVTALEVVYYLAMQTEPPAPAPIGDVGAPAVAGLDTGRGSVAAGLCTGRSPAAPKPDTGRSQEAEDAVPSASPLPVLIPPITADACPHAYAGRCHARARRPLGCRIFYCDPAAQHWQGPLTEEFLEHLNRLHWELGVPYFYADWMTVLRSLEDTHSSRD